MGYALFANSTLSNSEEFQAEVERLRQRLEALQTQSGGLNFVSSSAVSLNNETISNDELICSNYDDTIKNFGSYITVRAHAGNDYIEHNYYYNTSTYAITSAASYAYTDAGDGNDSIYNLGGTDSTVLGGAGFDYVLNSGPNALIYGGDDNDTVINHAQHDNKNSPFIRPNHSWIVSGDGNDSIINWNGHYSYIDGGDGADTIGNTAKYTTIQGGYGNDWIWNSSSYYNGTLTDKGDYVLIYGGLGDDEIASRNIGVTISGGDGNDTLYVDNGADRGIIFGGQGNDSLKVDNTSTNMTVEGNDGNDTISLHSGSSNNVIAYRSGDGDDTVYGFKSDDTVHIIDDSDYLVVTSGSDVIVSLDGGSILLKDAAYKTLNILGERDIGEPNVNNTVSGITLNGTDYNDIITNNHADKVTINAGAGDDSIYNYLGNFVTINAGDGHDSIYNDNSDTVTIDAGAGDDYITNYGGDYSKINAGDGDDFINNRYSTNVTIDAGAGDDSIRNYFSNVTINASAGHDYIFNSGSNVTINAGSGDDSITNNLGSNVTINGGAGDDLISLSSGSARILYANGDGFDTVYGYTSNATISITDNSSYSTMQSGSDVIVSIGTGAITLKDAADKTLNIAGGTQGLDISMVNYNSYTNFNGTTNNDYIFNEGEGVTIYALAGDDTINNHSYGKKSVINGGAGDDTIYNSGYQVFINGDTGHDTISNDFEADNVTIDGGTGYDVIYNAGLDNGSVNGYSGNDSIYGNYFYSTITGGGGNDIINFNAGYQNVIEYANGDNNDTIYGWSSDNTINITDGSAYSTAQSGSDVLILVGLGSIMLKDAAGQTVHITNGTAPTVEPEPETVEPATPDTLISNVDANANIFGTDNADSITNNGSYSNINAGASNDTVRNNVYANNSTLNGGTGNDSINNWASNVIVNGGNDNDTLINNASNALISGNAGNDLLFNSTENGNANNTLDGGAGNDIISLSGGANFIRYSSGDGNDTVYDYTSTETIAIEGGTYTTQRSGADTIIKVGNNQILVKNYNGALSILGERDTGGLNVNNTVSGITLDGTDYNDTIANNYAEYVSINAGAGNDYIIFTNNYTTTNGGAGNDSIVGNHWRSIVKGGAGNDLISLSAYWYDTIDGGADDDTILTGGFDSSVNGGSGNDLISLSGGNVTVRGGASNDTIRNTGSKGNLYQYSSGDGMDIIYGWSNDDTLTITGGSYGTSTLDNDVYINIGGGGTIILNGAKGKTVNINPGADSVNTVSTSTDITPQDVILIFMKSLDDSTADSAVVMLDDAIRAASDGKYSNIQTVIEQMINDCTAYNDADSINGWKRFLLEKCDIDLDNEDTGAISGYDAGGSDSAKTAENIVSANVELNSSFEDSYFNIGNLNVYLGKQTASNTIEKTNYDSLKTEEKKTWQGLQSGWLQNALSLNEKSYGSNFSFGSKSTSTLQENSLYVTFKNVKSGEFASVNPGTINSKGETKGPLTLTINTYNFPAFKNGKVDDAYVSADDNYVGNSYYFERILTHEFTHAVMDANIKNATGLEGLPQFVKDGLAELVHGADDSREFEIRSYAQNPNTLKNALDTSKQYQNYPAYAGGYMFFRYIAKQFSSKAQSDNYDVAIQSPSDSYNAPPTGILIANPLLTATTAFEGTNIALSDYGADLNIADASTLTNDVAILGGTLNDSINSGSGADKLYGGDGSDTLIGNAGDDTLTGGSGADLFVYESGEDVIVDYATGVDKIQLRNCSIANSTLEGDDVIINTDNGALLIKDGRAQLITVIDRDGVESTTIYGKNVLTADNVADFDGVTLKSSKLTLGAPFTGSVDLANFSSKVKKVDATKTTGAVELIGNDKGNTFKAGSGGSTLDGGGKNDKLYGGDGVDVFVFDGQGKDKIYNYAAGDRIVLTETVTKSKLSGKNLKITVEGGGVLTVNKILETEMTITTSDGQTNNYIFDKKHKTLEDALNNTAAQFPSDYWFLNDNQNDDELSAIVETESAVDLDYDQTIEALKPSMNELITAARHRQKK